MSKLISIDDFDKICGICLTFKEKMLLINKNGIFDMLMDCSSVWKNFQTKMPQQICEKCYIQLKATYEFQKQCLLTLQILQELVNEEDKELIIEKYNEKETLPYNNMSSRWIKDEIYTEMNDFQFDTIVKNENEKMQNIYSIKSSDNDNDNHCFESGDELSKSVIQSKFEETDYENKSILENQHRNLADILIKNYNIYDLTCNICNKEATTRSALLRHLEIHNKNRPLKYTCHLCYKKFYNSETLKKHVNRHIHKAKFDCNKCLKRFYVLSAHILGAHCKSAHKAKPIQCDKCSIQFYHPLQIERHEQTIHVEKKYICDICGRQFPRKNRLTKHKKYHTEERPHICEVCNRGFKTKSDLTTHVKFRHTQNDRREVCYICGKLTPFGTLTIHLDTHKDRSVCCSDCNKIFASKIILDRHVSNVHKNNEISTKYHCEICNKALGSKGSLKTHMLTTHSDDKNNECHICGRSYKLLSHVKAHIQSTHMDVRPHSCSVCNKAFHTKTLLNNHMRTHTGERPFSCSICGKSFGFKNVLKTHLKVHSK